MRYFQSLAKLIDCILVKIKKLSHNSIESVHISTVDFLFYLISAYYGYAVSTKAS